MCCISADADLDLELKGFFKDCLHETWMSHWTNPLKNWTRKMLDKGMIHVQGTVPSAHIYLLCKGEKWGWVLTRYYILYVAPKTNWGMLCSLPSLGLSCILKEYDIIIIIVSIFLERLSMWNMLNCAEQGQIPKYKTHVYNYKTHAYNYITHSKLSMLFVFVKIVLLSNRQEQTHWYPETDSDSLLCETQTEKLYVL